MTPGSLITDDVRALIGKESEPVTVEVEKGAMIKCARAVDDFNPIYVDEEAARKSRYGGLIAHWTYLYFLYFNAHIRIDVNMDRFGRAHIHGGDEYEFYEPIRPGDRITVRSKLADIYERQGRFGTMVFTITEANFWNQRGQKVGVLRITGINM